MAHFLTHSGARIGSHEWNLVGGHFVDLVVHARRPLASDQLLSLGQLAMTEDTRPVFVRRQGEALKDSLSVPPLIAPSKDGVPAGSARQPIPKVLFIY